jgi:Cysteine rich repeat
MKAWLLPLTFLGFSLAAQAQDAPAPPNARQACKADYQKFCSGVSRGGGRIADCLNAHKSDLSTACQEVLNKTPPAKDAPPPADQPPKSP